MKKIIIAAVLCAASAAVAAQNTKDAALGQYIHRITEDAINTCFDLGLLEIKGAAPKGATHEKCAVGMSKLHNDLLVAWLRAPSSEYTTNLRLTYGIQVAGAYQDTTPKEDETPIAYRARRWRTLTTITNAWADAKVGFLSK